MANRGVWMFLITLFIQTILQIPLQFGMQFGIMGMMMLAAEFGSSITITAAGEDADDAVTRLVALVERGFGE